ncbi:MAG: type II secretion system protein [Fuerstiella sp.]|nr:type II secretion system protein [Fuerstiella sp.]
MNKTVNHNRTNSSQGFTLVEMLVSVALVLLMMTLFASVLQMATDSVSKQQTLSENDQKARSLTTVIRSDFQKRTLRNVQPFFAGEQSATSPTNFGDRSGYFYVSTNSSSSSFDDLIQFTVSSDQIQEHKDIFPYFGRAGQLVDRTTGSVVLSGNVNQPEVDDGSLDRNFLATSPDAEVCYFIRNGNLYRRQWLIRHPLPVAGGELEPQPKAFSGTDFMSGYTDATDDASKSSTFDGLFRLPGPTVFDAGTTTPSTGDDVLSNDFYRYFDFSAYPTFPVYAGNTFQKATFHGNDSLSNENSLTGGPLVSLGKPAYRSGFDISDGLSREHLTLIDLNNASSLAVGFMGRFLHGETSSPNFNYPQQPSHLKNDTSATVNPLDIDAGNARYATNQYGIITHFNATPAGASGRGGTRAVEDLLLSNVHEFKIELWDEQLNSFVKPGYGSYNSGNGTFSPPLGDYHIARNLNRSFGADNHLTGTVFDSWHPDNQVTPQANQLPPYQPYSQYYPPERPNGPSPPGTGGRLVDQVAVNYWQAATPYSVGDVVFPDFSQIVDDRSAPANGLFDLGTDTLQGQGFQFAYRCVAVTDIDNDGTSGESGGSAPVWPTTDAKRFTENEVTWDSIDNRRSLKAVRITIRFQNQKSKDMRQLTLVMPLTDS